jgi:tetratricopeptide (TPR) repeat protein
MIYADLGQYDLAIQCYQRAIKATPSYIPSHINLANLYFSLRDFAKAVDELGEARRLDPTNYVVYVNIGSMCGKLSQESHDPAEKKALLHQSEVAFREALYFNHDSAVAAFNLAKVLAFEAHLNPADSGKMKEAVFYFNKACQLEPENPEYKSHLLAAQQQVSQ